MKHLIGVVVCILGINPISHCQNVIDGKDIYRINCGAVVGISAGKQPGYAVGNEFGVGFITSEDGRIVTANHVITTRESGLRQYAEHITVFVPGRKEPYPAQIINVAPTEDQVNHDAAVIKITATKLPHVTLGDWGKVEVGDPVTILTTYPGYGCLLLQGNVVAKSDPQNPLHIVLFQAPIRNGFSGSPIFNNRGQVIGIEDTKVFGISPALGEQRKKWAAIETHTVLEPGGPEIEASFLEMINNLDQNLISGLGSGVAIEYAKEIK